MHPGGKEKEDTDCARMTRGCLGSGELENCRTRTWEMVRYGWRRRAQVHDRMGEGREESTGKLSEVVKRS